ncbi:MAG: hypothetical protein WBB00_13480 [Mycobacterium sp.]
MKGPGRALIATGVAALTGGALVFTPSVLPATMPTLEVVRPVNYAANTDPGAAAERPTAEEVKAALTLIGHLGPGVDTPTVHAVDSATTPAVPFANHRVLAALAEQSPQGRAAITTLEEPVALNAASDLIDGVYSFTRYWANYVSLELGPWLINWIPFGYLISDQIYIWYPNFVLPTVDSFVYDFLDPVVNNPLNLAVWLDGIGDIINTAVTGVVDGIVAEIDYVLDFGWFPFPLPPLPDLPLLGPASDSTTAAAALVSSETTEASVTDESPVGAPAEEAVDSDTTVETETPAQKRTENADGVETETAGDEQPEQNDGTAEDTDEFGDETDEFGDDTGSEAPDQLDDVAEDETEPDDGSGDGQTGNEDAEDPGATNDSDEQSGDDDSDGGDDDAGASPSQD